MRIWGCVDEMKRIFSLGKLICENLEILEERILFLECLLRQKGSFFFTLFKKLRPCHVEK